MENNLLSCPTFPKKQRDRKPIAVLLVGNYPRDAQESMLRFAQILAGELGDGTCKPTVIHPCAYFGRWGVDMHRGLTKWLAYIDKFVIFPIALRLAIQRLSKAAGDRFVIHICDHANAPYALMVGRAPVLVTCHDLLAVRAALGERTDCEVSRFGKFFQRWIVSGLSRAAEIACVSTATLGDLKRIVPLARESRVHLVPMGLNYAYGPLSERTIEERLARLSIPAGPFVLHVGSNHPRKNREGVLRSFARTSSQWKGFVLFAGNALTTELRALADSLRISDRVVEIHGPDSETLEALYNKATALLFPSRFEGFGWPIIEAQACGCPVICSNSGPLPEVAGEGAWIFPADDEEGFASAILRLVDPSERTACRRMGFANVERFSMERMIESYRAIYERMVAAHESLSVAAPL